ncbi:MAG: dTDP-4-amino-4,6-dideoxygalactose transaminase [Paludibacteraceae bacterium]|nr:dTDP-4-amino-4,6-dideoxygalactose transaminase [Paludibacteraceae bacterium]MBQ8705232.1 dTDP-4-amino-4,6-dideoxygalactose transaminase [Paludibacteraceae bacterium]
MINFNQPHLTGKEAHYMYEAVYTCKLSGNGKFTKACQSWFENRYGFRKALLTTSGTDALEMCAMLCELQPGDEVIVPSYTFVSTALAFLREGAKVVFADSMKRNPNLDAETLEALVTPRTKVIVPVHYAGVACDMEAVMAVAEKHHLLVVEDAAQAIDSYYKPQPTNHKLQTTNHKLQTTNHKLQTTNHKLQIPLGSIGHLAAFSFHETKNITAGGEGGLLVVNDERFVRRAEIIWEKGTNRAEFFRGEVNKYGWVDMGSSFLPSEVNAAFLWAQLENIEEIQAKRKTLWDTYWTRLKPIAEKAPFSLPDIPPYATNNAHMFYLVLPSLEKRTALIAYLKENGVGAVFHYLSLHSSPYYKDKHDGRPLPECDRYADCLVRLPLFFDLTVENVNHICDLIETYYR